MPELKWAAAIAVAVWTWSAVAHAADADGARSPLDPVLVAMSAELERATAELAAADPAPYFLALEVTESRAVTIAGEEGGLQGYEPQHKRWVDVDVRIGDPALDSTHALRGGGRERPHKRGRMVALGSHSDVIQRDLWREVDRRFVEAQERWAEVQSEAQTLVGEAPADDLAPVEPRQELLPLATFDVDLPAWEAAVRRASAELAASEVIHDGSVRFSGGIENHWFVSSEGARLRHSISLYRVSIAVDTVADDGEQLQLTRYWDAFEPAGLPDADTLVAEARALEALLVALRDAPEEEPYNGPAILSERAAAVFFHEILGHRLEGHRLKQVTDAQTFRNMVGQPILPPFLSVVDDPTLDRVGDQDLRGHYAYDNQGVAAQRAVLVRDGVLEGFLQSRSPVSEGQTSNGHGRRQAGFDAVTRQGNLVIEASETVDDDELRAQLVQMAEQAGLEYGLRIEEIQGGFTFTGRSIPNAFNVKGVLAYRVFVDGRPDELIRGVDLIGTPLVTFSRIVRAGGQPGVFNGSCGAESGWVPVSAVSPALLVSQVETQRKPKAQEAPPLLPPPSLPPAEDGTSGVDPRGEGVAR